MAAMEQVQMVMPSPTKLFTQGVTLIIVLSIAGFLLSTFAGDLAINFFALNPQNVLHGRIWQLVTYPFIHVFPMNLIFDSLMILFLGSAIERGWRTGSFLLLWVVVSVCCGLIWIVVSLLSGRNLVGMGAAGCAYGIIGTLGLLFRGQKFFVFFGVIEGQYLAMILLAIGVILGITAPINLIWVSGAAVAYLYIKLCWRTAEVKRSGTVSTVRKKLGSFVDID